MNIDRSQGMRQICKELEKRNINLSQLNALDMFARKGDWQTFVYANHVKTLEVWEIDSAHELDLKRNLPNSKIKIIDSIATLKGGYAKAYDFIVIDNPQNTFGQNNQYCEHFDVLPHIAQLIENKAIAIFNINKQPFDLEQHSEWNNRRNQFYKLENTSNLSIEFLIDYYTHFFYLINFKTIFHFHIFRQECKPMDYLHYFVFYLEKIKP